MVSLFLIKGTDSLGLSSGARKLEQFPENTDLPAARLKNKQVPRHSKPAKKERQMRTKKRVSQKSKAPGASSKAAEDWPVLAREQEYQSEGQSENGRVKQSRAIHMQHKTDQVTQNQGREPGESSAGKMPASHKV